MFPDSFPEALTMSIRLLALLWLVPGLCAAETREVRFDWLTQGEASGSLVTRIGFRRLPETMAIRPYQAMWKAVRRNLC